jgi:hypothetical protein
LVASLVAKRNVERHGPSAAAGSCLLRNGTQRRITPDFFLASLIRDNPRYLEW